MQFTTVRSKEKDYDIYVKSGNLVHSNQKHEKNVSKVLGIGKYWFLAVSSLTNTVAAIWREKKNGSLLFGDYERQLDSKQLGARKKCFPAIWNWKTLVPSYFEPDKHCGSSLEREKSRSLLFGHNKMQFTTVSSKKKEYDMYLKSEKLFHSNQEHEKYVSQLFGRGKIWFLAISSLSNTVATILREKKVDPCYLETKKCSSQWLGARKKSMTCI